MGQPLLKTVQDESPGAVFAAPGGLCKKRIWIRPDAVSKGTKRKTAVRTSFYSLQCPADEIYWYCRRGDGSALKAERNRTDQKSFCVFLFKTGNGRDMELCGM